MPYKVDEARVLLAIQATKSRQKLTVRQAARLYEVPHATLARRVRGIQPQASRRDKQRPLTLIEEE